MILLAIADSFFFFFGKVSKVEVVKLDLREESYDFLSEEKPVSH